MPVDVYEKHHKPIATWLLKSDYELLQQLAEKNNVTLAAYARAIIVDAIQDELYRSTPSVSTNQLISKVV